MDLMFFWGKHQLERPWFYRRHVVHVILTRVSTCFNCKSFLRPSRDADDDGRWETRDFTKETLGAQSALVFFPAFSGS